MENYKTSDADLDILDEEYGILENLTAMEEHFFRTAEKTDNSDFGIMANEVAKIRKGLQVQIWPFSKSDGENWCNGKHLPCTSMRFMEAAAKHFRNNDSEKGMQRLHWAKDVKDLWFVLRKIGENKNGTEGKSEKEPEKIQG
ncbi:MAG: hypothetical protein ACTSRU_17480 [Candidatus Hodarchaeales archaeon]